jgi:hypothetical protein
MKVCALSCVKNHHELLAESIRHLLLNGISDFYLYDHGSRPDVASFLAEAFGPSEIRVRLLRKATQPFVQRAMVGALAELARLEGFEAAVAFDADEFWCSTVAGRTLVDQIAAELTAGVDALTVPVVNYVQQSDVEAFGAGSLLTCGYSVVPFDDPGSLPWEQVESGMPFVAMPFPSKVIARLSRHIRLTEGQHGITGGRDGVRVLDTTSVVVRHLSLPCREYLAHKREQGVARRIAGDHPTTGWQLQRLANMTDGELDDYWEDNSWRRSSDGRVLVGAYDGLVEDDALVRIGTELLRADRRFGASGAVAATSPVEDIPFGNLELVVERLVDDLGAAERTTGERDLALVTLTGELAERASRALDLEQQLRMRDERLTAVQEECDGRAAQALALEAQLEERDRELTAIKSSRGWRALCAVARILGRDGGERRVSEE